MGRLLSFLSGFVLFPIIQISVGFITFSFLFLTNVGQMYYVCHVMQRTRPDALHIFKGRIFYGCKYTRVVGNG